MTGRKKGSITIFMSLMLMLIASLLFTLLEGSRYMILGMTALINSQSVTESMFAEYNVPAYDNYHLFMMDSSFGTGQLMLSEIHAHMQELGQENLNPAVSGFGKFTNFLQMNVTDSSITRYELAADDHAAPLLGQMTQVMKKELAGDILQQAYKKITGIQDSCDKGKQADGYLDEALDTLEQAKEAARENDEGVHQQNFYTSEMGKGIYHLSGIQLMQTDLSDKDKDMDIMLEGSVDNPMEDVKRAKSSPLLALILSDGDKVSVKQTAKEDALDQRTLNNGNYGNSNKNGALDKLLITQYLKKYTTNYRRKSAIPHALLYEQEYILFGKFSDEENLKKMANRMLLLREGLNFAYLLSDSGKREEALAMATALTLFAGIPAAVTAIQMGILASWAYAESIAELRTLFSGGRIATIKTAGSWTVGLSEMAAVLVDSSIKSKEADSGQKYEDYLQAFLIAENIQTIGKRFANLLEKNIRLYTGYESVKMDCMITAMETNSTYHAQQVFLSFVTITQLSKKGYCYEKTYDFSYLKQKNSN